MPIAFSCARERTSLTNIEPSDFCGRGVHTKSLGGKYCITCNHCNQPQVCCILASFIEGGKGLHLLTVGGKDLLHLLTVSFAFMNGKGKQVGLFSAKTQSLPISPTPTLIPLQLFLRKYNFLKNKVVSYISIY